MKTKLTERAVARLKLPASGKLDVWDQTLPAFGIQLRATGRRTWIIAVRRPGKSTTSRIKIGDPATMPLAEARTQAQALMRNPSSLKKADPEPDDVDAGSLTGDSPLSDVLAAFIAARKSQKRNRTWKDVERLLTHDLRDWYSRPLRSITRKDVRKMIARPIERGSLNTANLLLANIKRLLNWALETIDDEHAPWDASPAADIKYPAPKAERERTLTNPELYEVWHGCNRLGWPFGPLVQLLMLTAQRENEVATMRWSDLDLETATWTLASSQTKAGRAHLIPLSVEAVRILKSLPRFEGCDLVFPASRTGNARPVSGFSKVKVRLDKICGVDKWVLHDLRRTVATAMARLKVPPHVTEKILNHRGSAVAGPMGKIYQRYDYLEERREALDLWASTLRQIVETNHNLCQAA